MSRLFSTCVILLFLMANAQAQTSSEEDLGDRLFFGMLTHKPDSAILPFLKRYFPYFTKPAEKGGWTSYPPGPMPVYDRTIHCFEFTKHPAFKQKFTSGRLELFAEENDEEGPKLKDFQLWLYFNSLKEAEAGFKWICSEFRKVSKSHKQQRKGEVVKVGYSEIENADTYQFNEIILLPDVIQEGRYKIRFRLYPKS